jgi:hypothetical protein
MPDTIRVFVNQRAMELAPGTLAMDAASRSLPTRP